MHYTVSDIARRWTVGVVTLCGMVWGGTGWAGFWASVTAEGGGGWAAEGGGGSAAAAAGSTCSCGGAALLAMGWPEGAVVTDVICGRYSRLSVAPCRELAGFISAALTAERRLLGDEQVEMSFFD